MTEYTEWDYWGAKTDRDWKCEGFMYAKTAEVITDNIRNYDKQRIVSIGNNKLGRYFQISHCPFCGAKLE